VLASARPHLRAVREALANRRISFIGVKLEPLADVSVVRDLEALARALESPLDRVAWLAVLRAPFVGLSLADLTTISEQPATLSIVSALLGDIPGLSIDGAERLLRAKPLLLSGWREGEREARAHLIERTWLALGGASACTNARELVHARRFLAALDEEDRKRMRGRQLDLDRLMERLYAEDPAQPDAVSLMTIHGAKGLEFDHVFVVGVGLRGRPDDPRLLNWLEIPREQGGDHLVMAPIRVRGNDEEGEDDSINRYLRLLHRERARAERSRQAYVALTRAKLSLHLFVHPRVKQLPDGPEFSADANSMLHNLWPAIGGDAATFEAVGTNNVRKSRRQSRRRASECRAEWPPSSLPRMCRRGANLPPTAPNRTKSNSAGRARLRDELAPWFTKSSNDLEMPHFPRWVTCRACVPAWNRGCRRSASNPNVREPAPIARSPRWARRSKIPKAVGCSIHRTPTRTRSSRSQCAWRAQIVNVVIDRTSSRRDGTTLGGGLQDQPARGR
jgi:ATP-dependent exoDNAse (exonuclease V) beta subunit